MSLSIDSLREELDGRNLYFIIREYKFNHLDIYKFYCWKERFVNESKKMKVTTTNRGITNQT